MIGGTFEHCGAYLFRVLRSAKGGGRMNARRKRALAAAAAVGAAALAVLVGLNHGGETAAAAQYGPTDFTVETTADAPDLNPGDGVCATAVGENNACTLRAAIQEANTIAGANTIHVPAGTYTLSIAGPGERAAATGDLDITDDLTIDGAGSAATIVDGGGIDRVFDNFTGDPDSCSGPTTTISGLTVRNGSVPLDVGGGIFSCGSLSLADVVVAGNSAGAGGGISNEGSLTLSNSRVDRNTGLDVGGGIFNNGGTVTIEGSGVSGNQASRSAGGIGNWPGSTITLINSTVSDNKADAGGGLASFKGLVGVTAVTVTETTFTGNNAIGEVDGGGAVISNGTLTITNSTISGNHAANLGAGIFASEATVTNSTITNNVADAENGGGGLFLDRGGSLKNTIVAGNRAAGNPSNCAGANTPTSAGHNLEDTNSCGFAASGDLVDTNPTLGPLQDNGGPTFTQALLTGSPAIDSGDNSGCPSTDQRGQPRPIDGDSDGTAVCDIGAYEAAALIPGPGGNPPVINALVSGTIGLNGWYRSNVTVSWSVASALSTSGCDTTTVTFDTPGSTFTCTATSPGGMATATVMIKRDATPPNLTCTATPDTLWPANHKLVPVTTSVSVADELSGPAGFVLGSVTSTEGDPASDVQGWTLGDADTSGFLRAERSRADGGRTYTLTYQGTDVAGNSATCDLAVTVPLHKSQK